MHMRVHDESLVAKNWKCEYCENVMFAKKSDLVAHHENEHGNQLRSPILQSQEIPEEQADEQTLQRSKKRKPSGLQNSQKNLEDYFARGNSGFDLLLNTVGRKRRCGYDKCYRTFKTEERYQQHIEKHKIHDLKLKILEDNKRRDDEEKSRGENPGQT